MAQSSKLARLANYYCQVATCTVLHLQGDSLAQTRRRRQQHGLFKAMSTRVDKETHCLDLQGSRFVGGMGMPA